MHMKKGRCLWNIISLAKNVISFSCPFSLFYIFLFYCICCFLLLNFPEIIYPWWMETTWKLFASNGIAQPIFIPLKPSILWYRFITILIIPTWLHIQSIWKYYHLYAVFFFSSTIISFYEKSSSFSTFYAFSYYPRRDFTAFYF